jgi:thiosulfate dehydrogenase (quinone) large subunit
MLSAVQALPIIRVGFGLYFLSQALDKTINGWFSSGEPLARILQPALPRAEVVYRPFLEGTVLPNVGLFAQLVTFGEWVVGLSLVLGLLTRGGALLGMWLNANYMLMKGLMNNAGSSDRLFFLTELMFLLAAAGLVWGLDGSLRDALQGVPVVRWLAGIRQPRPSAAPARP